MLLPCLASTSFSDEESRIWKLRTSVHAVEDVGLEGRRKKKNSLLDQEAEAEVEEEEEARATAGPFPWMFNMDPMWALCHAEEVGGFLTMKAGCMHIMQRVREQDRRLHK